MVDKIVAGRYRIQGDIGAGGMGTVFKALDSHTNTVVAVKQLKSEVAQPEMIERFKREGEALRDLNHPNIVKMIDAVEHEGQHYLVMEYVPGGDLTKLLEQGKMPVEHVLALALDLADALTRAHKLNIIHRDLKPANVLIGEDGVLRLTDFGVAHVGSKQRVTGTDAIIGTIDYLPPEAFGGSVFDARGDIWAFGVILFEMLSGQRPFPGATIVEVIHAITLATLPDLETLCDAPVALVDLVYRMLAKDPQARVSSVRIVGAELEAIVHGIETGFGTLLERFASTSPAAVVETQEPTLVEGLTEREAEVLALLAAGLSNKEIAERLVIEVSTVKWYNRQIYGKLGVQGRAKAVIRAKELGLVARTAGAIVLPPANNLPTQSTPFVGRETELQELMDKVINPQSRLVTILATGGMGKSRLALELAYRLTQEAQSGFVDGVYFVELAPLSSAESIPTAIATTVNYQFQAGTVTPKEQILNYLANKRALLILDNYEHLLDGADLAYDIVQASPNVKVLVTSRERLNFSVESVYALKGMAFPTWKTPEDALRYEAVQLLAQTAKRAKSDWAVTQDNLDYVARVCRLTEGMPLGIILAASWLDVYGLERICEEIQKSADFLDTEMADIPRRQRSIRAVFDATWNRLKPAEQQVFMKMSVFRGGCSPRAAETVTGANARVLQALVNKAMLTRNPKGRFDIHELLRQYAEAELGQADDITNTRDAHAHYYATAMHERETDLRDGGQVEALSEIVRDFENVQAAWVWAIERNELDAVNRLLDSLNLFCQLLIRYQQGLELFDLALQSLNLSDDDSHRVLKGRLLARCGRFHNRQGEFRKGREMAEAALQIARERDDKTEIIVALRGLAGALDRFGQPHDAWERISEALTISREIGDRWAEAELLRQLGYLASARINQLDDGQRLMLESLSIYREIGDKYGIGVNLLNLGLLTATARQYDQAEDYYLESLAILRELGVIRDVMWTLINLSGMETQRGHFDEAEEYLREMLSTARQANDRLYMIRAMMGLAGLMSTQGRYHQAQQWVNDARGLVQPSDVPHVDLELKLQTGFVHCGLGDYAAATENLYAALRPVATNAQVFQVIRCLFAMTLVLAFHENQPERALEIAALVAHHWATGFWDVDPLVPKLLDHLKENLPEDTHNAAWKRGKSLNLDTVVQELLEGLDTED